MTNQSKQPRQMTKTKILLSAIIASGLVATGGCSNVQRELSKTIKGCTSETAEANYTMTEIVDLYNQNAIAFDSEYKGKCITVIGAPTEISTTTGYSITLSRYKTKEYERQNYRYYEEGVQVLASFEKSEADSLQGVQLKGSLIKISGVVGGIVDNMYINLEDSKLDGNFGKEFMEQAGRDNANDVRALRDSRLVSWIDELEGIKREIIKLKEIISRTGVNCSADFTEEFCGLHWNFEGRIRDARRSLEEMKIKQKEAEDTIDKFKRLNPDVCTHGSIDQCFDEQYATGN